MNFKNIKEKHINQPAKIRATPNHINVLLLLNHCGQKPLILKNVCVYKMFCAVL
jgi:hypothetical protein